MSKKTETPPAPKKEIRLRSKQAEQPLTQDTPRFHVFLVDTGWNQPVSKVLNQQLPLLHQYHPQDSLYILSREQSIEILKKAPEHIGRDPLVIVYDLYRPKNEKQPTKDNYRGFRLNLGLIKNPEQALAKLQQFLKFIAKNRTADCIDREVRHELHQEGLENLVKLLRDASEASLELL
jgi:hypothetical protein